MIVINIKFKDHNNFYKFLEQKHQFLKISHKNKSINFIHNNQFINSIEFIDNKQDNILFCVKLNSDITYYNLYFNRHNIDIPSITIVDQKSYKKCETYFEDSKYHRIGGPAMILSKNNIIICEKFYKKGEMYKKKLYSSSGKLHRKEHYVNSIFHRLNKPAIIEYYPDGTISTKHYYSNGVKHRLDGPATIQYFPDGNIKCEQYYVNGLRTSSKQNLESFK